MIVVASGGMYTEPLDVDALDPAPAAYDGTKAYARCKRAQVVLAEEWTRELLDTGITVNAMHPGWADTPGLRTALPGFTRVVGPLLRTPAEGADTIVWLAAAPDAAELSGLFFLDRRARAKHRLRRTRRPDEAREAARLWRLCTERTAPFGVRSGRLGSEPELKESSGFDRGNCDADAAARRRPSGGRARSGTSRRAPRRRPVEQRGLRDRRSARAALVGIHLQLQPGAAGQPHLGDAGAAGGRARTPRRARSRWCLPTRTRSGSRRPRRRPGPPTTQSRAPRSDHSVRALYQAARAPMRRIGAKAAGGAPATVTLRRR